MLERWQRADIITAAQAEQIRAAEASATDRRIPLVAEVLGYLGLAFILTAGGLLMARLWESLGVGARSGILALVTLLLVLAGWAIRSGTEPALRRLSSFLWLAAVGGAGATADVVATDGLDMNTGFSLPAGVVMTALGLALWLVRKSAPQLVGLFAGVVLVCAGLSDLLKEDAFGMLLFAVGVAGVALARLAALLPQGSAYVLSSAAMLFGAQWTAFDFLSSGQPWALELGVATGLALLALSVAWRTPCCSASERRGFSCSCRRSSRSTLATRWAAPPPYWLQGWR